MDHVEVREDLELVVRQLVASGRFKSADAVMREGLRLLEERERRRAEIDAAVEVGLADSRARRVKPMDEVFDRLEGTIASKGLWSGCRTLGDMPASFPLVPVRRRVYASCLIFYTVAADDIRVLRILHGARDVDRILFPTD